MFVVTVDFQSHPDHVEAFRDALKQQAFNSLSREAGCKQFDLCLDDDNPTHFFLYELYVDAAAFDEHVKTQHFLDFSKLVEPWTASKTVNTWTLSQEDRP
ncbi:MAG: putative quinol monooxygenase [Planctomycetota bacterium]